MAWSELWSISVKSSDSQEHQTFPYSEKTVEKLIRLWATREEASNSLLIIKIHNPDELQPSTYYVCGTFKKAVLTCLGSNKTTH